MSNDSNLVDVVNTVFRMMRMNGLAIVCFDRCGYTEIDEYKSYLKNHLGLLDYVPDVQAEMIAECITDHAQTMDSDFINVSRRIDQAFVDNSSIEEFKAKEFASCRKIRELELKIELLEIEAAPLRTIFSMLARRLRLSEIRRNA
jgi:hypothetical protein